MIHQLLFVRIASALIRAVLFLCDSYVVVEVYHSTL